MKKIYLQDEINNWAEDSTAAHIARRKDLIRDKTRMVIAYFRFVGIDFGDFRLEELRTEPNQVGAWRSKLETTGMNGGNGLSISSVHGAISKVSSFYKYLERDGRFVGKIGNNPCPGQYPKLLFYNNDDKPLSLEQTKELLAVIRERTESKTKRLSVQGWRDLAITLHLLLTGRRRAEVLGLTWGDFDFDRKPIHCTYRIKGGYTKTWDIQTALVELSMRRYLQEAGRLESMVPEAPIWVSLRDSPVSVAGRKLTASAYAKTMKVYARKTDIISKFWVHRLRYTNAVEGLRATRSIEAQQETMGHRRTASTIGYSGNLEEPHADLTSEGLAERLGLNDLLGKIHHKERNSS